MVEIIAEIGNTHEGSIELAKCFIKSAKDAGVDAVKFQFHIFDEESLETAPNPPYFKNESRRDYFTRTSFNYDQWFQLKRYSNQLGLKFYCSPFSILAGSILNEVGIDGFKIASGEVTNLPLLESIASYKKPIILSSGMSSLNELMTAKNTIFDIWKEPILTCLQCTSKYPCPPSESGVHFINELTKHFKHVGFSDHTTGVASAIIAIANGATVLEKHFTLSKSMYGPDASFSLEPGEMIQFVKEVRDAELADKAQYIKDDFDEYLTEMKTTFQKSIVASSDISSGTKIEKKHLAYKKPFTGISAANYKLVIGRILNKNLKKNELLLFDDLV